MINQNTIEEFANNFVKKSYRVRFIHEVKKKPSKMMGRICHRIEEVFPEKFKENNVDINNKTEGYLFTLTGDCEKLVWKQAYEEINCYGGGGYLFIGESGKQFYAESESTPPDKKYKGNIY